MIASGGRSDAFMTASPASRRSRPRTPLLELQLKRAQDLRLVVDDEDARATHASAAAGKAPRAAP